MDSLSITYNENVLVGVQNSEDAGVYKVNDEFAMVQSLDFFTPIVDDPYTFGRITAANALSDIYAMGGVPLTAMNIVAFPMSKFPLDVLKKIMQGGLSILNENGVQLLGGHSVDDEELKYGLSVTGRVHPDKVLRNTGMKDGDSIILTKPLGTGIIGTAVKSDMVETSILDPFVESMTTLNRSAAELLEKYKVNACTDVTGFGLAGHLKEMLSSDGLEISINSSLLPVLPGVENFSKMGIIPGGLKRNRDFIGNLCSVSKSVPLYLQDILFDPQTSGGLLVALDSTSAKELLDEMKNIGLKSASIIATVKTSKTGQLNVV